MTRRPGRSRRALAALAATLLALPGCTAGRPGAAAVVDRGDVAVTELQDATRDLLAARARELGEPAAASVPPEQAAAVQRDVLTQLILFDLMQTTAARRGVQVSEGQVDALAAQVEQGVGGPEQLRRRLVAASVPPSRSEDFLRYVATGQALAESLVPGGAQADPDQAEQVVQEALTQTARETTVQVNPRYGTWDPTQLRIEGSLSGGLARSVEELVGEREGR